MKLVIYGKEGCKDCEKSKLLCEMQSLNFKYLQLGSDYTADELPSNVKSMPLIYIKEPGGLRVVGGYNELRSMVARLKQVS